MTFRPFNWAYGRSCKPSGPSFFACGDLQSATHDLGCRSLDELTWACPGLRADTISRIGSVELNELARAIVGLGGGDVDAVALPQEMDNEGVPPALAEGLRSLAEVAAWLAARIIVEIEGFVKKLPSIAVLVMSDAEVEPLAQSLAELLVDNNIKAVPCRNGQTIGNENDVRVFDIQHIKGLEFEAVFFVGVDRLATS